jgi:hypothetical protein
MKNILLALVLVLVVGCKKKKTTTEPTTSGSNTGSSMAGSSTGSGSATSGSATGSATGSGSAMAGSGSDSDSAGSASGYKMSKDQPVPVKSAKVGWAPVDDAIDGKSPWLSDANAKAGLVELIADDDLSGKTKGTFTTKRLCGDAAKKAAATAGEIIAKRSKDATYDQTECRESGMDPTVQMCLSGGLGEGDFSILLHYKKVGDTWTLIGIQNTGVGIDTEKQETEYQKLLGTKCK